MSYDKNVSNYTVAFKNEIDYLNCRIDYLGYCSNVVPPVDFLEFIQDVMYDTGECEVESIEPTQYTGGFPEVIPYTGEPLSDLTDITIPNPSIDFTLGTSIQNDTLGTIVQNDTSSTITYGAGTGSIHISENLIVDGSMALADGSFTAGTDYFKTPTTPTHKEEPPVDPIDSRFDILDL